MRFNPLAYILLVMCALVPDLLRILVSQATANPHVPYEAVRILKMSTKYPWPDFVFAFTFGIGCYIVFQGRNLFGVNEIVALIVLLPVLRFLLPLAFQFISPFLGPVGAYLWFMLSGVFALLLALIIAKGFQIELGFSGILFTGLAGFLVPVADVLIELPFKFQTLSYTILGAVMSLWIASETDWGRFSEDGS